MGWCWIWSIVAWRAGVRSMSRWCWSSGELVDATAKQSGAASLRLPSLIFAPQHDTTVLYNANSGTSRPYSSPGHGFIICVIGLPFQEICFADVDSNATMVQLSNAHGKP